MAPIQSVLTCVKKAFIYSERASRSEFWWYFLFYVVVSVTIFVPVHLVRTGLSLIQLAQLNALWHAFSPLNLFLGTPILGLVFVVILIPLISVGWRRLHDIGWPGWVFLIPLIAWLLAKPFYFAMWVTMGDGAPPVGLARFLAYFFMVMYYAVGPVTTVGSLALYYLLSRPSSPGENRFGISPVPEP